MLLAGLGSLAGSCVSAADTGRPVQRVSVALAARHSLYHLPLTLAEQLGYSNLSSFTRWFSAQFECTPSQMRERSLAQTRSV